MTDIQDYVQKNNSRKVAKSTRVFKDRKDDQLVQDWNLDVNFDQQEMLIYEHIDKQLEHELFLANWIPMNRMSFTRWGTLTCNTNELIWMSNVAYDQLWN